MTYKGETFYTASEFIKWCFDNKINNVETSELLRELWNMKNIEIGNMLEWYYKEKL